MLLSNSLRYARARGRRPWFQSLLSWMLLSNASADDRTDDQFQFQSLLSWMLLSNSIRSRYRVRRYRFQSLFSWMLLSNSWRRLGGNMATPVSILVILDVALKPGRCSTSTLAMMAVSILVILDVALKRDRYRPDARNRRRGFNPCYPGCCSQTDTQMFRTYLKLSGFNPCYPGCCSQTQKNRSDLREWKIVSILVILDVALKLCVGLICQRRIYRFQSLLSWMLLSNGDSWPAPRHYDLGFNPCYPGCCSQTVRAGVGGSRCGLVSILVILDVALKPDTCTGSEFGLDKFQSLLSWMLLSNAGGAAE